MGYDYLCFECRVWIVDLVVNVVVLKCFVKIMGMVGC